MAYNPIVNVSISINATQTTQQGFGTPLFVCAHRYTDARVIEVNATSELTSAPYNFPSDHPAVLACTQAFSQQPRVSTVKIGRRDMQASIDPEVPTVDTSTSYTVTLQVGGYSRAVTISVTDDTTGGNAATKQDVCDSLKTEIDNDTQFEALTITVSGVDNNALLIIESTLKGDASTYFTATSTPATDNTTVVYNAVETPSDTITAITQEDSDWYFVASDVKGNDSYIIDMATVLNGIDVPNLFFHSSSDVENLSAYQAGNTDLFARLRDSNMDATVTFFHHDAENFVEMAYIGANAPYDAGSVTWANVQIRGVGFSQDPSRGRPLTTVQKSALQDKNANYVELDAGTPFTRTGVTAGGEWIDVVRGVDWQQADIGTALRNLLVNQKGGKVPYNDLGGAMVREAISSSLQRGVNRQFLDSYEVTVPKVTDISTADRLARILTGVTFQGVLAGAIHEVTIAGEVTV